MYRDYSILCWWCFGFFARIVTAGQCHIIITVFIFWQSDHLQLLWTFDKLLASVYGRGFNTTPVVLFNLTLGAFLIDYWLDLFKSASSDQQPSRSWTVSNCTRPVRPGIVHMAILNLHSLRILPVADESSLGWRCLTNSVVSISTKSWEASPTGSYRISSRLSFRNLSWYIYNSDT